MGVIEIIEKNQQFFKIATIEKEIGLKPTILRRMIARKKMNEIYKDKIERWWHEFVCSLQKEPIIKESAIFPKPKEKKDSVLISNINYSTPTDASYNGKENIIAKFDEAGITDNLEKKNLSLREQMEKEVEEMKQEILKKMRKNGK